MKFTVIEQTKDSLKVVLDSISPVVASTLRRTIINSVPVLAIEDVDIITNYSGLYDDVIAHRLGMIPFTFDPSKLVMKSDCSCGGEGCGKCEVKMVLNKTGPCSVYAKDIKVTDSSVKPVDGNLLIVTLLERQSVSFEIKTELNVAKEHAKWQSSIVGYEYEPSGSNCSEKITFDLRSISGLSPKQILLSAIDIIKGRLDLFEEAISHPGKDVPLKKSKAVPSKKSATKKDSKVAVDKKAADPEADKEKEKKTVAVKKTVKDKKDKTGE